MFATIIRTIIGTKFQINPLTITLFSGSGPWHTEGDITLCQKRCFQA